jgi:hypothetical protein
MKTVCSAVLAAMFAFSAFPEASAETVREARVNFENKYLDVFRGRVAKPAETADAELRYDKAKGEGLWRFMLQLSTDDRVRFIDAKFSCGKFISGNMHVFGLESVKLDADDFDLLKRDFVMAASKIGSESSAPVVIYRSRKKRLNRTASWKEVRNFRLNPISDLWGAFPFVIKQRGVKVDSLACTVDYESKDGVKGTLGKFVNASKKSSYNEAALHKALVKIHADAGADPTKINMRKAVDLYIGARLKYTPVD